jgi:hypothetical protein
MYSLTTSRERLVKPSMRLVLARGCFPARSLGKNGGVHAKQRKLTRRMLVFTIMVALFACIRASADVGVVLLDSVGHGLSGVTGSGHSAVYFSHICPASPIELRFCSPEEQGSVLSTYSQFGFGKDHNFEWNVVPLNVFLYGVEDPHKRPLFASAQVKNTLEAGYQEASLLPYCGAPPCATSEEGQWRAMVGAALTRTIYVFAVATTVEQDREFIARFNARPNEHRFNAITRNCADFTRDIVNTFFPNATHRNYLNDFGMTSPKSIARSFVKFARHNPDLGFYVLHTAQLPGTIKRSSTARAGTEQLFRSKKLLVPTLLVAQYVVPASVVTYLLTGRFNAQRELESAPTPRAAEIRLQIEAAMSQKDAALVEQLNAAKDRERTDILGSSDDWERYRQAFAEIANEAVLRGLVPANKSLDEVFKRLDELGTPILDGQGNLWIEIRYAGGMSIVGANAANVLAPDSDFPLAYQLLLARVDSALNGGPRNRPAMTAFAADWALLQQAQARIPQYWSALPTPSAR